jgi:hypothetical protein
MAGDSSDFRLESGFGATRDAAMNLLSSFSASVAGLAGLPGDSVTSLLREIADYTGLLADDSPDGWLGLLTSGLAGIAAALAVAIMLTVYFRTGYRSVRDIVRHGVAAGLVFGLLAFVVYDMRHAALAYLGINPAKPAVEFEIRLPTSAAVSIDDGQLELHTDQNQTLARMQSVLASDDGGRSIIRGSVALEFRTTDRVMILNLPGQPQHQFKLRLAANPSHTDEFGPWHLADRVGASTGGGPPSNAPNDAFAIRYRVI